MQENELFRDANIDWRYTSDKVDNVVGPLLKEHKAIVTQGFIGSTDENESTTLGREGSDYTAAVFANLLNAEGQYIWKDVEGVMNADPKEFRDAQFISELNYAEVIEMAYYGAQVIHPKTIKPLQNKKIPLYVKCFLDKKLPGTVIDNNPIQQLPPIIVIKQNQALVHLHSKDFSFVTGEPAEQLHELMKQLHLESNLTQNTAISLLCCFVFQIPAQTSNRTNGGGRSKPAATASDPNGGKAQVSEMRSAIERYTLDRGSLA